MGTIIEKELKVLEINSPKVQDRLLALGAVKSFEGEIHDIYYDTPKNNLYNQKKRVRIRKKGNAYLVTFKKLLPTKNIKSAHETEMYIQDPKQVDIFLQSYGLKPSREKRKKRISYTIGDVTFDIDKYKGIPPVLEIEAKDKRTINAWIRKLGLQKKTTASFGTHGLFKYYNLMPTSLLRSTVQK